MSDRVASALALALALAWRRRWPWPGPGAGAGPGAGSGAGAGPGQALALAQALAPEPLGGQLRRRVVLGQPAAWRVSAGDRLRAKGGHRTLGAVAPVGSPAPDRVGEGSLRDHRSRCPRGCPGRGRRGAAVSTGAPLLSARPPCQTGASAVTCGAAVVSSARPPCQTGAADVSSGAAVSCGSAFPRGTERSAMGSDDVSPGAAAVAFGVVAASSGETSWHPAAV